MIELAALCIIVVVGIFLIPPLILAVGYLLYGAVMFCAYMIAVPFVAAYHAVILSARFIVWLVTSLYAAATNPGWRQSFLKCLDTIGSTGIKAYRLAQRLAAR